MMTDDETAEQGELEGQFRTATEGLQRTVMRLFQDSDIHPHVMVLALARVTGEVGAGTALAEEQDPEGLLGANWPRACGGPGGSSGRCWRPKPCLPRGAREHLPRRAETDPAY